MTRGRGMGREEQSAGPISIGGAVGKWRAGLLLAMPLAKKFRRSSAPVARSKALRSLRGPKCDSQRGILHQEEPGCVYATPFPSRLGSNFFPHGRTRQSGVHEPPCCRVFQGSTSPQAPDSRLVPPERLD